MPNARSLVLVAVWILCVCPLLSVGQSYPTRPLRLITAEPGGGADFVARLLAPGLSTGLGQQVVIDNRGGAGGAIAIDAVAKAQPDGYTVLLYSNGMWTLPLLQNVPYDPVKDFSPVGLTDRLPNILVVHPSLPVTSVQALIALAKSRPGDLNFATGSTGSSVHLAAEMFKAMSGVDVVRINYKSSGRAQIDLMGGQVQFMFPNAAAVMPQVKSGRLRAIAVTTAQPSPLLPGLPTIAASGLPGFEADSTHGVFAPAGTPRPYIDRLNVELLRVLNVPDVKARFLAAGVQPVSSTPELLGSTMRSEMARMGKLIKDVGIRSDL